MESTTTESCSVEEEDCSDSGVPCLMRVGKKFGWLRLFENTEVTVGRGVNVTYQLLSATCPLMISRLHCTFKRKEDGQWTVTDKKSLNGVWINGIRIPPDEAHLLRLGDSIQLGVPVMGSRVEFDYVLIRRPLKDIKPYLAKKHNEGATAALITESSKRKMTMEEDEPSTSKPKLYRCSSSDKSFAKACPLPLKKSQLQQSQSQPETTSSRCVQKSRQCSDDSQPSCDLDELQIYSQNILLLREQVDDTQRRVASLEGVYQQGDPLFWEQVQKLQSQLGTRRAKIHQMEALKKSFSERRWPEHEKTQREEQLRKQLNDALQEQKKVINEHALSRQAFEKILSAKNRELEATKEEKERARAQKEEVVTQMTEVLENELQCIICSELFIEAVTLNCAHSFCSYCINQWRKKKEECPICRQAITSQSRCLALDNFIERMMENLSLDVKEKRQSIINERKGEQVCESSVQTDVDAEVMVIHDDDSSSNSSSNGSSIESDGSMLSIFSSSSSVFTVDTESSDHLEFEISDDLED